jgi:TetR/AcrR family transcriptional regulator, transcriptional repressor for nem operon
MQAAIAPQKRCKVPKPSHREKILTEGMRVMHRQGFSGSSVRDIIKAAGVPQGSFTNHFASKEAFGLEVLNVYYKQCFGLTKETLLNDALPPLARLRKYIDGILGTLNNDEEWNGCMIGNFGAEHSEGTEQLQERVREIFLELQSNLAHCLKAAIKAGELPKSTDVNGLSGFIVSSIEGAVLTAKSVRSRKPMEALRKVLFDTILTKRAS